MTSYATCAHTDCYKRISYEPKEDAVRPRYCDEHMEKIAGRMKANVDDYDNTGLYIQVVYKRD